jgi:hypothetical protein
MLRKAYHVDWWNCFSRNSFVFRLGTYRYNPFDPVTSSGIFNNNIRTIEAISRYGEQNSSEIAGQSSVEY